MLLKLFTTQLSFSQIENCCLTAQGRRTRRKTGTICIHFVASLPARFYFFKLLIMSKAFVALVGRPNVGKSTLFNRLVGERLSVVDDRPAPLATESTRNANGMA